MVIFRRHQADAVAEADFLGALRTCRKEYFRCRGMRIFFQKMMFDFPCVIDAELVGELDLVERLLKKPELVTLVPWPRKLMFVENPEFHWASRHGSCWRNCRAWRETWQAPFSAEVG